jgi:hypothetical protein
LLFTAAFAVFLTAIVGGIGAFAASHIGLGAAARSAFGCVFTASVRGGGGYFPIVLATGMQAIVGGIGGGFQFSIVTCGGYLLLYFAVAGFSGIIAYHQLFGILAPYGGAGTGFCSGFFYGSFTHATVAPNLNGIGSGIAFLGKRKKCDETAGYAAKD